LFTGIIREIGVAEDIRRKAGSLALSLRCPQTAAEAALGDSVAVDGVCLTVTSIDGDVLTMDVGEETHRLTTLSGLKRGGRVNVEPSLRVGDKLGGHWVLGHVDAVGSIAYVRPQTTQITFGVRHPAQLAPFIAKKGSVAVDGISLTVGETKGDVFEAYVIPHTAAQTTLGEKKPGATVNLEADVLARYAVNAANRGGDASLLKKLFDYDYAKKES